MRGKVHLNHQVKFNPGTDARGLEKRYLMVADAAELDGLLIKEIQMNNRVYEINEDELVDEILAQAVEDLIELASVEIDSAEFESIYTWFLA